MLIWFYIIWHLGAMLALLRIIWLLQQNRPQKKRRAGFLAGGEIWHENYYDDRMQSWKEIKEKPGG